MLADPEASSKQRTESVVTNTSIWEANGTTICGTVNSQLLLSVIRMLGIIPEITSLPASYCSTPFCSLATQYSNP